MAFFGIWRQLPPGKREIAFHARRLIHWVEMLDRTFPRLMLGDGERLVSKTRLLKRMPQGTFGECTECGGDIEAKARSHSVGDFNGFPLRERAARSRLGRMLRHSLRSLLHEHHRFPGRTSHSGRRSNLHTLPPYKA